MKAVEPGRHSHTEAERVDSPATAWLLHFLGMKMA